MGDNFYDYKLMINNKVCYVIQSERYYGMKMYFISKLLKILKRRIYEKTNKTNAN